MTIQKIQLLNFRNFKEHEFEFSNSTSLIVGNNGVGKTNLLESLSMLAPGKGLRNSPPYEICKFETNNWQLSAHTNTIMGESKFDISYSKEEGKKLVKFNGSKISQSELTNFTNIMWLTPEMDGLFLSGPKDRRKFLDRIVFGHFSNHAQLVNKYEKLQRERVRILEANSDDSNWLDSIEIEMANLSITITENRLNAIGIINKSVKNIDTAFPKASLELDSEIVELLNNKDSIRNIAHQFKENRYRDKISNKTNFGAHKSDLRTYYSSSSIPAEECSTGQQKALLISIIIAQQISYKKPSILLLDEIFVHLDDKRKAALAKFLEEGEAQVFITSTEKEITKFLDFSKIIEISDAE